MRLLVLIGVTLAVALGGGAGIVVMWGGSDSSDASRRSQYRGSDVPAGSFLPRFRLRNYTGELVRSDSLREKVVLVTFLESKCVEACPIIAAEIRQGLALLTAAERRQVAAVAVSTHPGDDTPANVRAFVQRHRLVGRLDYLIGSEQELRSVWRKFHILSALESGDADTHSAPIRVFDRDGEWVTTLHPGVDLTPGNLAHDVREALR
jgi:cytochrome oxidase Cu insertion factor (SCO1/SenC/PrrC family)